jgi:demethylmenaquinone methyltransferase/2-methoxy-6-polyprenyl-1,4-benzoquinol methylase
MASPRTHNSSPLDSDAPGEHAKAVRAMFSAIAPRYDLLNHLLSMGVDRSWRRRAVACLGWESKPDGLYLDVCAGTFDLAIELAGRSTFGGRVVAFDFARAMLQKGLPKIAGRPIAPLCADALNTPLAAQSFDGAMVAFGVRNLADIAAGLREARRLLRPGACLVILDFATPPCQPLRWLYRLYFRHLLPIAGRLISKHSFAYTYLPESVEAFAEPEQLAALLRESGFEEVDWELMTGGIACVWTGVVR